MSTALLALLDAAALRLLPAPGAQPTRNPRNEWTRLTADAVARECETLAAVAGWPDSSLANRLRRAARLARAALDQPPPDQPAALRGAVDEVLHWLDVALDRQWLSPELFLELHAGWSRLARRFDPLLSPECPPHKNQTYKNQ